MCAVVAKTVSLCPCVNLPLTLASSSFFGCYKKLLSHYIDRKDISAFQNQELVWCASCKMFKGFNKSVTLVSSQS